MVGALANGVPRCFAVTAVSVDGFESDRSPLRADTPRPDARNVVLFALQPAAGAAASGSGTTSTATARRRTGELGLVRSGARRRHRLLRRPRRVGRSLPDPGRPAPGSSSTTPTTGRGPHHRSTSPPIQHAIAPLRSLRSPGFGYVFEMDGGDGLQRYGAVRVTHVGPGLPHSRLGLPDRSGQSGADGQAPDETSPVGASHATPGVELRPRRAVTSGHASNQPAFSTAAPSRSPTWCASRATPRSGSRVDSGGTRRALLAQPAAGRGRHRVRPDDLRDQYRLRQARQRARSRPTSSTSCRPTSSAAMPRASALRSPADVVRAVMLLRANVLLRPTSGVRPELVDALVAMLNAGIIPLVPEQGSVGASGDLARSATSRWRSWARARCSSPEGARAGRGRARRRGARAVPLRSQGRPRVHQRHPGADRAAGAAGARRRGALAHRGRRGGDEPRGAAGNAGAARSRNPRGPPPSRPDRGGRRSCGRCWPTARSGNRTGRTIPRVQDAYSLRCAPQVLGAVADAIRFAEETVAVELNASTDNPLVFDERRGDLGRQLPRPAGGPGARHPRHDADDAAGDRRAAGGAAGESRTFRRVCRPSSPRDPGLSLGLHDGADHRCVAGRGVARAGHARQHRIDPDRRQPGGLRAHGDGGGLEGAADPGQRAAGGRRRSSCARRRDSSS